MSGKKHPKGMEALKRYNAERKRVMAILAELELEYDKHKRQQREET